MLKLRVCQKCCDRHFRRHQAQAMVYAIHIVPSCFGMLRKKHLIFCAPTGKDVKLDEDPPKWCPYTLEHLLETTKKQTLLDWLADMWAYVNNDY